MRLPRFPLALAFLFGLVVERSAGAAFRWPKDEPKAAQLNGQDVSYLSKVRYELRKESKSDQCLHYAQHVSQLLDDRQEAERLKGAKGNDEGERGAFRINLMAQVAEALRGRGNLNLAEYVDECMKTLKGELSSPAKLEASGQGDLEKENARLAQENERLRQRIEKLTSSDSQADRSQLKLLKAQYEADSELLRARFEADRKILKAKREDTTKALDLFAKMREAIYGRQ